jgi:hypothetical protein
MPSTVIHLRFGSTVRVVRSVTLKNELEAWALMTLGQG